MIFWFGNLAALAISYILRYVFPNLRPALQTLKRDSSSNIACWGADKLI
jgi:hypothetical protein